jgi:coenzyme F420-0:L-glutamate ligase / coenzyme F420-1:gamma-L-glutamate ligase
VPVCFAWDGTRAYFALDEKPKQVAPTTLKRVRNILAHPNVALLIDYYSDDWRRLAYVLLRGAAILLEVGSEEHVAAIALLRDKYSQYRAMAIEQQPVIRLAPERVVSWFASSDLSVDEIVRPSLPWPALVRGRRSVRQYTDRAVAHELAEQLIAAGGWAPSPHGRQPWRFAVITDAEVKVRLAEAMGVEWRRNLAMDGEDEVVVNLRLAKSRARILGAPLLIIPCLYLEELDVYPDPQRQAAETTMAIQSLGAAAQNILLTAYALGLDGSWVCAPLFCPEVVVSALDLATNWQPHALLTIGYAAADPKRRPRKAIDELVAWYELQTRRFDVK